MKETIFEVVDLINRQDINNACWGVMPIYGESDLNFTDKLFGTSASMELPNGTYLYWYVLESERQVIDKLECKPHSKWVIAKDLWDGEKEWLYLWKIF